MTVSNEKGWGWLVAHERFLLVTFGLGIILFLGYKFLSGYADITKAKADAAQQTLSKQEQATEQLQQSYQQLQAKEEQDKTALQAQNLQLANQTAAAYKAAAAQAVIDQNSTNQQLAARLGTLTGQTGIQSTSQGVDLTHDQSIKTTSDLEELPALKLEVQNDNQTILNDSKEINDLTGVVTSGNMEISSLKVELVDQTKACTDQINNVKAQARKSKLKWFLFGAISGFVGGMFK